MLQPAIKYEQQLVELFREVWFDDRFKWWNAGAYYEDFKVHNTTWDYHQFVSIKDNRIIGYIGYSLNRSINAVSNLSIVNFFDKDKMTFGIDLAKALKDIFEEYHFNKINFYVIVGNPVEPEYDKIVSRYGGRIVGIFKDDVKLIDGQYYDQKYYEILDSDYFTAKEEHKI